MIQEMLIQQAIKMAVSKYVPPEMKQHLPKIVDFLNLVFRQLDNYLGEDDKAILIRKQRNGPVWFLVIDVHKEFTVSQKINFFTTIKKINLQEFIESIINKYILPHITIEQREAIGKMSMEDFTSFVMNAKDAILSEDKTIDINNLLDSKENIKQIKK